METLCPYCKTVLKKFPIRKTKCFNCGENIHILKFNNHTEKKLVTEEEKAKYQIEENRIYFRNRWLKELNEFGLKDEEFYTRKKEFVLKLGIENNDSDVFWSLFNELLIKNSDNYERLSKIYHRMAIFLFQEGKDFYYLLRESLKANLKQLHLESLSSELVSKVQVLVSSNACDNCKKLAGMTMTYEEALTKMPIPIKDCDYSRGWYRCFYAKVHIRDDDGMLMLKNEKTSY